MTFNELVSRYFSRNIDTIPLELNENIQRKYKKYGELARYAFKVPEGICFIRHWNEGDLSTIGHENSNFISIVLYYTFVNEGMMSETQTKAIHNEKTRYLREYYNNLLDDVIKEAFPLTLNLPNKDDKELNKNMEQMISMEECEQMGSHTEDKIFNNVISKLNERHQSSTGLTYFDQLSIDLAQGDGILKDAFPEAHAEILSLMHEEYRALDELEQHCLFLYLFTNDRDEGEIVDSMYYHFEDWMEERAYNFLNQAKNGASKN